MGEITKLTRARVEALTEPSPILPQHSLAEFNCDKTPLNDWLRERALKSEGRSARTYVICIGNSVIGYYCLSTGGISHAESPRKLRQNMPNPIPVMVLGRLAIDRQYQRRGIGSALFGDALKRVCHIHNEIGAAALIIHAIDDEAKAFYVRYGMQEFPIGSRTLFLPIQTAIKLLAE